MQSVWLNSMVSVFLVSAISLAGIVTLVWREKFLNSALFFLVSFSTGALLGDVFLHLLPELGRTESDSTKAPLLLLSSIVFFFILERIIRWHHHHAEDESTHVHPVALLNLVGDGVHNLLDGMIIAGAYLADFRLGIATTIAVVLHEIPQEVGDFAVLIHSGMTRGKALFFNFLSALTALLGAAIAILLAGAVPDLQRVLIALGAGGFIYIATADLIPELHKETGIKKSLIQLSGILLGVAVMYLLLRLE